MYEIYIQNRGPEGIRGYRTFRTTQAKSEELQKRIADKDFDPEKFLAGMAATEEELAAGEVTRQESASSALSKESKKK